MAARTVHLALHFDLDSVFQSFKFLEISGDDVDRKITSLREDLVVNAQRQARAAELGMEQARPGRLGDTGTQVRFNLPGQPSTTRLSNVNVAAAVNALVAYGYRLVSVSRTRKPVYDQPSGEPRPGKFKWVLRFVFSLEQDEEPIRQEVVVVRRLLEFLEDTIFQMCVVWENSANDTVNVTRVQEGHPRRIYCLGLDQGGDYIAFPAAS